MKPVLSARFASGVARHRARVNKATGAAVRARLERIRDTWGNDVRVDSGHYKETVLSTEPVMTSPTSGHVTPPFEIYFAANEFGGPTISARPSMRQAIAAEEADFANTIINIVRGITG